MEASFSRWLFGASGTRTRQVPCQPGGRAGALSGVVQHDDLGGEVGGTGGRLVFGVGGDVASLDVLD